RDVLLDQSIAGFEPARILRRAPAYSEPLSKWPSAVVEKHLAEGATRSVGIDHAGYLHSWMLVLPVVRCMGRSKEADGLAGGGGDGAHMLRRDNRDDRSGRLERADAGRRIDCEPYGSAGGRAERLDTGRTANHGREEQGVQRTPRIQLFA